MLCWFSSCKGVISRPHKMLVTSNTEASQTFQSSCALALVDVQASWPQTRHDSNQGRLNHIWTQKYKWNGIIWDGWLTPQLEILQFGRVKESQPYLPLGQHLLCWPAKKPRTLDMDSDLKASSGLLAKLLEDPPHHCIAALRVSGCTCVTNVSLHVGISIAHLWIVRMCTLLWSPMSSISNFTDPAGLFSLLRLFWLHVLSPKYGSQVHCA